MGYSEQLERQAAHDHEEVIDDIDDTLHDELKDMQNE